MTGKRQNPEARARMRAAWARRKNTPPGSQIVIGTGQSRIERWLDALALAHAETAART